MKLIKCMRDGVEETKDLTVVESTVIVHSAKMAGVGAFGVLASKLAVGAVAAKVMLGVGVVGVGAVFMKSFVRGFREEWQHQKVLQVVGVTK